MNDIEWVPVEEKLEVEDQKIYEYPDLEDEEIDTEEAIVV